jgi:hypothetical protein
VLTLAPRGSLCRIRQEGLQMAISCRSPPLPRERDLISQKSSGTRHKHASLIVVGVEPGLRYRGVDAG